MDIKVVHIYNIIFTSCPNIQKILLNKKDVHVETTPYWKNINIIITHSLFIGSGKKLFIFL